jgi:hypothetical protein
VCALAGGFDDGPLAGRDPDDALLGAAAGRAWSASGDPDWLAGARAGLGADTPLGPIDVAYGIATSGRRSFYLRIGKWF